MMRSPQYVAIFGGQLELFAQAGPLQFVLARNSWWPRNWSLITRPSTRCWLCPSPAVRPSCPGPSRARAPQLHDDRRQDMSVTGTSPRPHSSFPKRKAVLKETQIFRNTCPVPLVIRVMTELCPPPAISPAQLRPGLRGRLRPALRAGPATSKTLPDDPPISTGRRSRTCGRRTVE